MSHALLELFEPSATTAIPEVVVLGIGNSIYGDDGAGPRAIERLQQIPFSDRVALIDGGTLNFTLLEHIEGAELLVVVDAAEMNQPPGTTRVFEDEAMDRFLRRGAGSSVHEVGLSEICDMSRLRGRLPARRLLFAIQPEVLGWSSTLSDTVEQAVDLAVATITQRISEALA